MNDQSVVLINMPWSSLHRPSIQLGTLKSILFRGGIETEVRSFNLAFMDFLLSSTADLPDDKRLAISDYHEVSERCFQVGLGDWIFAVPPFRDTPNSDEQYLECLLNNFKDPQNGREVFTKASQMRELVPAFLERCVDDVMSTRPAIVGFTTTFSQNVASLVLAKLLKLREPSLHIVFGGSNCDGPMGDALHRSFPWVDSVVRGEAERVLPEFIRDVLSGGEIRPQPGLCYRENGRRIVLAQEGGVEVPMDEVPVPDYDEYFERLEQSRFSEDILPDVSVPFESARGCWWGEKAHCTFCGLNGSSMAFRSKSGARVLDDLMTLAAKHRHLNFNAVDNIIAMPYFREVLPKLSAASYDFSLFYETKSNLKKDQLWAMREAGVNQIQPGIESLSTSILKLMNKGVTALQNIRLLKWCEEFGIEAGWSVLYGFPGEPSAEFDRMAGIMKGLSHLQPPRYLAAVDLERFSPYHQRPREYGIEITGPKPFYRLIYPCEDAALNDIAYTFSFSFDDGREPETYIASITESIATWQKNYPNSSLNYRQGPGFIVIHDRRPEVGGYDHTLDQTEADVYLGCDGGATPQAVWQKLQANVNREISVDDVRTFLDEMVELDLMYEEGGVYLSLAVATNPEKKRRSSTRLEEDSVLSSPIVGISRVAVEV